MERTPGTTLPAIVDRLITLHATATGLQVVDGTHLGEVADEAIAVGTVLNGQSGYSSRLTPQQGRGGTRYREAWTVRCFLSLQSGEVDMAALRNRAGGYLAAITTALADEPVAEGVWDKARLGGEFEWLPIQDPRGAICSVLYEIAGEGLL